MSTAQMEHEVDALELNREVVDHEESERRPVVSSLHELVAGIEDAECEYVGNVKLAVQTLLETLREQIGKDSKLGADINNAIQHACRAFETSVSTADNLWDAKRQNLTGEIENIEIRRNPVELMKEITDTENRIAANEDLILTMLRNSAVELSTIMRTRMAHSDMKSYLKGLRFQAGKPS